MSEIVKEHIVPGNEMIKSIVSCWKNNDTDSRFKIGQYVFFHSHLGYGYGTVFGVNNTGEGMEYALEGLSYLLWEKQLQETK